MAENENVSAGNELNANGEQNSGSEPTSGSGIHRVATRVPPFWPEKPELWFCQLEGQFHLNGITQDNTKFWYVVSNLESRYAAQVEDIITSPPASGKYVTLKNELVKRLSTSQQQKLKQLLEHEEIGDRTPSQFLRHLRNLAGTTVHEDFLRTLWLGRLPEIMQAILAAQADLTLDKVAEIADKIKETHSPRIQVNAVSQSVSAVDELTQQVKQLALKVEELSRSRPEFRERYRSRSRSSTPYRHSGAESHSQGEFCWYHARFGDNAKKCRSPCTYVRTESGNAPSRH